MIKIIKIKIMIIIIRINLMVLKSIKLIAI